jgi:TolB-like protein/Tfp pilus assembly protein PilF
LNDDADAPRYIETVPRRGYRFIGPIQTLSAQTIPAGKLITAMSPPRTLTDPSPPKHNRMIWTAFAGIFFALVAAYYLNSHRTRASGSPAASRAAMLAILPFQNMTSDPSQESFSDGMTEETTTRLARLNSQRFHVIARTSAMKYKGAREGVVEIAKELHADYLLEGSVRRQGTKVRISCQLIRASDQSPRWTQEYNFDSNDSLSIETQAAETIASQLNSVLGDPSSLHYAMNDDAFDSYLRGLAESSIHTPEGLDRIIATFEKAVVDNPNHAQPLAGLAHVYERGTNLGFLAPKPTYAKARAAADRAIQLDPTIPEAHVYLADALLTVDYDWAGAQNEIQKALALNANDPMAHEWNGIFLSIQDKTEPALEEMRRAVELDPLNADRKIFLAQILDKAGQPMEAEDQLKAALELDPASTLAHTELICLYTELGRQDDAISEWSALFFIEGQPDTADAIRANYRKSGFEAAHRLALKQKLIYLTRLRRQRYVSAFSFAAIHAELGDTEEAIQWLQKAYAARDVELPCISNRPSQVFVSIQNDPRVVEVLKKIRAPQSAN